MSQFKESTVRFFEFQTQSIHEEEAIKKTDEYLPINIKLKRKPEVENLYKQLFGEDIGIRRHTVTIEPKEGCTTERFLESIFLIGVAKGKAEIRTNKEQIAFFQKKFPIE